MEKEADFGLSRRDEGTVKRPDLDRGEDRAPPLGHAVGLRRDDLVPRLRSRFCDDTRQGQHALAAFAADDDPLPHIQSSASLAAVAVAHPGLPDRPSDAWRLVENRAALLRVGHQRTVASVPKPAAPQAQRLGSAREACLCVFHSTDTTIMQNGRSNTGS
jgi:hypothetical protein